MKKPKLYKTPIVVAWVLLTAGFLGMTNMVWLSLFISGYDGMDGGFAFLLVGLFLVITAAVVFFFYGRLNRDFREMLTGRTLLACVLPRDLYTIFSDCRTQDIKSGNKAVLFAIYGFSVVFGFVFSLMIDPLFILIFLGIDVFFTAVYFITTAFRTGKVARSQALVYLSEGGVYLFGQLHDWSLPGARLLAAEFDSGQSSHLPCPVIRLTYLAAAYPAPRREKLIVPVPAPFSEQAASAAEIIQNTYAPH